MQMMLNSDFRILCVEDESAIRRDIADELRDHGFTVFEAEDGAAALEQIERTMPHLIISDIQMPRMDGHQLLCVLRARSDETGEIPFVFLTAFGDRTSMVTGRREGADDYLVKPVDFDLLIAAAESHLVNARRRASRATASIEAMYAKPRLPGQPAMMEALASCPKGTPFAIIAIDNLLELLSRLSDHRSDRYIRFFQKLELLHGIRVFQLAASKFGVIGRPDVDLPDILTRLVNFPLRDRVAGGLARGALHCSVVTHMTSPGLEMAESMREITSALKLLQREGGRQVIALAGPELQTFQQASAIREEVVDAIGQGQLTVQLQPKVSSGDRRLVGAEVLVRWHSPRLGSLSPATFIPILERAGLLHHVTDWVLRKTAQCQVDLTKQGVCARLAVNIGANEFEAGLPARIDAICSQYGADPSKIELEITETTLMADLEEAAKIIDELRARRIRIALDDFGTGYSSLSYLSGYEIDVLKIDRSFVAMLATSLTHQKVVEAMIEIGRKLGLEVVAEGVERDEQLAWLHRHGCGVIQGHLVSTPLSEKDFIKFALDQAAGSHESIVCAAGSEPRS